MDKVQYILSPMKEVVCNLQIRSLVFPTLLCMVIQGVLFTDLFILSEKQKYRDKERVKVRVRVKDREREK